MWAQSYFEIGWESLDWISKRVTRTAELPSMGFSVRFLDL